jgi:hypothetical protein
MIRLFGVWLFVEASFRFQIRFLLLQHFIVLTNNYLKSACENHIQLQFVKSPALK